MEQEAEVRLERDTARNQMRSKLDCSHFGCTHDGGNNRHAVRPAVPPNANRGARDGCGRSLQAFATRKLLHAEFLLRGSNGVVRGSRLSTPSALMQKPALATSSSSWSSSSSSPSSSTAWCCSLSSDRASARSSPGIAACRKVSAPADTTDTSAADAAAVCACAAIGASALSTMAATVRATPRDSSCTG